MPLRNNKKGNLEEPHLESILSVTQTNTIYTFIAQPSLLCAMPPIHKMCSVLSVMILRKFRPKLLPWWQASWKSLLRWMVPKGRDMLSLNKRTTISIGHHLSHTEISYLAQRDARALLGGSLFSCALVQGTQMGFGVGISYANVWWLSASLAEGREEKQLLRWEHVILFIHEQLDGKIDGPSTENSKIYIRVRDYLWYPKILA